MFLLFGAVFFYPWNKTIQSDYSQSYWTVLSRGRLLCFFKCLFYIWKATSHEYYKSHESTQHRVLRTFMWCTLFRSAFGTVKRIITIWDFCLHVILCGNYWLWSNDKEKTNRVRINSNAWSFKFICRIIPKHSPSHLCTPIMAIDDHYITSVKN